MRIITLLLSFSFCINTLAQNFSFGKVSKEELEETFNPLDSSASAAYLYKYRRTFFEYNQNDGFQLITEIQECVKIYNQGGFYYATKVVGLSKNGSSKEELNSLKANTYNLVDGKVEETKLEKDGIFETEENDYYKEFKFTMPNIKSGSVIEYKYRIISPFLSNVDEFVFQLDIPVKKLYSSFEMPEYFYFNPSTKGYLSVTPKIETKNDKITFYNKAKTDNGYFGSNKTTYSTSEINYKKTTHTFDIANITALKSEPYINNIDNYRSSIKYELAYTKFPNSTIEYFSTSWEDVVKKIYKSPNFGGELDKKGYYEDDVNALISSISDPLKRVDLIYNFVKSKVNWNGYYGKYTKDGVKKAYKDNTGNVAEINLMLTSMLRHAGLNAYPVLVSTRQNRVPLFPTINGYNYVVSYVKFPEGDMLLDASNKYSMPNLLPFRALNWQGRIITEEGNSSLIDLYPNKASKNNISMMLDFFEDGTIQGNYRSSKTNHNALLYRENYNNVKKEDYIVKLENKYKDLEILDFEVLNSTDLSLPITESYKFKKENQADKIGDKIYFSPMFFLKTNENPFKLEKREFPVDFGYPESTSYRIIVNLPEGYKVEAVPEPFAMAMPDNLGTFKYNIFASDKKIQVTIDSEINQSIITPIHYEALKTYFGKLVEKEAEQIVLTKI